MEDRTQNATLVMGGGGGAGADSEFENSLFLNKY